MRLFFLFFFLWLRFKALVSLSTCQGGGVPWLNISATGGAKPNAACVLSRVAALDSRIFTQSENLIIVN
jgi:hypothetical protein